MLAERADGEFVQQAALKRLLRGMDVNILAQIGFVGLIGLAAKNAILIVEFARQNEEHGEDRFQAATEAARVRLRPILMTSFAFILGCVPLWTAQGSGAAARRILGTVVITGKLPATIIAIFLIPVTYYVVEKLSGAGDRPAPGAPRGNGDGPRPKAALEAKPLPAHARLEGGR